MKILIIEDEEITANDLIRVLKQVQKDLTIVAVLESLSECQDFFQDPPPIDLIFSDIQLGDGNSFDFFQQHDIETPVIFCTAFQEYALDAFKTNAIEYVMKPFNKERIQKALEKYQRWFSIEKREEKTIQELTDSISKNTSGSLLIHHLNKIHPIPFSDIALIFIKNELVQVLTKDGKKYPLNKSMEELEVLLPKNFYRANRQFIVHREGVEEILHHEGRKLLLKLRFTFNQEIIVSKAKSSEFLKWLKSF